MAFARIAYVGDGSTTDYSVPFDYISKDHVKVKIGGEVYTNWTWVDASTIRMDAAPATSAYVLVYRQTSPAARLVNYEVFFDVDGDDLNIDSLQAFYLFQEAIDLAGAVPSDDENELNAGGKRITNLADGVEDTDAVTVGQIEPFVDDAYGWAAESYSSRLAAEAARDLALSYRNSANAAKTAAETAETNAETAESNAETAQAAAEAAQAAAEAAQAASETAETNAETAETNAETAETNAETAQAAAEVAQSAAEDARDLALTYRNDAQTAKTGAETAETNAETAQVAAEAAQAAAEAAAKAPGLLHGLTLSNSGSDATNDIVVASGVATDDTGSVQMRRTSTITKRLDANWAAGNNQGGRDTGSISNATWHVWLIGRTDLTAFDILFSLSATSPTMPSGYTYKLRIGSIVRASGAIRPFVQRGDLFLWGERFVDWNSASARAEAALAVSVPSGIVVQPIFQIDTYTLDAGFSISVKNGDNSGPTFDVAYVLGNEDPGATILQIVPPIAWTNTSAQIRFGVSIDFGTISDTVRLGTFGYIDRRGRDE